MNISGSYKAETRCTIDYIAFHSESIPEELASVIDDDGMFSIFWDESEWDYDPATCTGSFTAYGVYVNGCEEDVYADGHLDFFEKAVAESMQVYGLGSETAGFVLTQLELEDGEDELSFPPEELRNIIIFHED